MKSYDVKNERKADYEIDRIFIERWSPRALTHEGFSEEDLMKLFEAARWAPSNSNNQPWRFLYALHGAPEWRNFYELLDDFNRLWAENAGALIVVLSKKTFDKNGEFDRTHSYCAGSAWMNFALQAKMNNLIAHGMAGFDYNLARKLLRVPEDYDVEAMIAVGKQGEIENLHERMQKSEKPNSRKKVSEFAFKGKFPN